MSREYPVNSYPDPALEGWIGPYRLLKILGKGGMGTVYLALQEAPIHRYVAVKVLRSGLQSEDVVERFNSERQALAMMSHPIIARVYDAGIANDGRPYFVLEYVPGIPITDFCDRQRLTLKERLELFLPVCHAVQHAHQKGIIHRDVKPSNILVTIEDGEPTPKIIDFGLAKAANPALIQRTVFTQRGVFLGTPAYMSPEQAELDNLDIDITSDIYSLGVVLYELLTGTVPLDFSELMEGGFAQMRQLIREKEPPSPSNRIAALGETATTSAEHRRADVAGLKGGLKGELDWITMKALEKDRTRRYPSASEFASDLQRYLSNEPVTAGPPSVAYQIKKLLSRYRVAFAFAATVIVLIFAFAVVATLQARRIAQERDRVKLEARRANLEAQALELMLISGDFAKGNALMREALALHRQMLGNSSPELVPHLYKYAFWLEPFRFRGSTPPELSAERERLYREALRIRIASLPPGHPGLGVSRKILAEELSGTKGRAPVTSENLSEAADLLRRNLSDLNGRPQSALLVTETYAHLSDVLIRKFRLECQDKQYDRARADAREAISHIKRSGWPPSQIAQIANQYCNSAVGLWLENKEFAAGEEFLLNGLALLPELPVNETERETWLQEPFAPGNVRRRILGDLVKLSIASGNQEKLAQYQTILEHQVLWPSDQIRWTEFPRAPRAQRAVLTVNPDTGDSRLLVRFAAGTSVPLSNADEMRIFVHAGTMIVRMERRPAFELGPGSWFILPRGAQHEIACKSGKDCVIYTDQPGRSDRAIVPEFRAILGREFFGRP